MFLVKQCRLAKQSSLLKCVRSRNQITEQLSVDVSGTAMPTQLHFAIGHFSITPPQNLLHVRRHVPIISGSAPEPSGIKIHRPRPEPPAGRCHSAMREVVHRNGVTQSL